MFANAASFNQNSRSWNISEAKLNYDNFYRKNGDGTKQCESE